MFVIPKTALCNKIGLQRILLLGKRALPINPSNSFATAVMLNTPKEIKRGKTPIGRLDQQDIETEATKSNSVPDPYAPFPDGINPATGERGGPRGPEPTRYGDWERKGRVSDF